MQEKGLQQMPNRENIIKSHKRSGNNNDNNDNTSSNNDEVLSCKALWCCYWKCLKKKPCR